MKAKNHFLLCTALIVLLVLTTLVNLARYSALVYEISESKIFGSSAESSARFEGFLTEKIVFFESIIREVQKHNMDDDLDSLAYYFADLADDIDAISSIWLATYPDGEWAQSKFWTPPDDYVMEERPWFEVAMSTTELAITKPYLDVADSLVVALTTQLKRDGETYAILSMDIYLETLQNIISCLVTDDGLYSFVIDENQDIIIHPIQEYSPTQDGFTNLTELKADYTNVMESPEGEITTNTNIDGNPTYGIHSDIISTNWKILTCYPTSYTDEILVSNGVRAVITICVALFLNFAGFLQFSAKKPKQ
ncbi:MAG: hypothetical protein ATN35_12200 [Epulopiscium sp. Nele67-Bin004]|nr:MAG: hypothetical protein ATN35_12200 [Epulopiscium sp. Nele67-Bin004]